MHAGGNQEWDGTVSLMGNADGTGGVRLKLRASGVSALLIKPTDSPVKVRHLHPAVRPISTNTPPGCWCSPPWERWGAHVRDPTGSVRALGTNSGTAIGVLCHNAIRHAHFACISRSPGNHERLCHELIHQRLGSEHHADHCTLRACLLHQRSGGLRVVCVWATRRSQPVHLWRANTLFFRNS